MSVRPGTTWYELPREVANACGRGNLRAVEAWLDEGSDGVDERGRRRADAMDTGWSLVMIATSYGHDRIVEMLLRRGASPLSDAAKEWCKVARPGGLNAPAAGAGSK